MSDGVVSRNNPVKKWGSQEKASWLSKQSVQRSYLDDVVDRLNALEGRFTLQKYAALSYAVENYPLYLVKSKNFQSIFD